MKAVQLIEPGKPLELREVTIPNIREDEVLIRIKAAGICYSDVNYRKGILPTAYLPITLGHEIAGIIEKVGNRVQGLKIGDRVCVHYLLTCGDCKHCQSGNEQFCKEGKMMGNKVDGGYAEYIAVPARNAVPLPKEISFEEGAIMMCSTSTSFHALLKGRIKTGETVAIFGIGGLGQSAIQLAKIKGAKQIFAIDISEEKLAIAEKFGAISINGKNVNPIDEIKKLNHGEGVDIALELIGLPQTQKQAIQSLGIMGRAVFVGLTTKNIEVNTYRELLANEGELIGANDHHLDELYTLLEYAKNGDLQTSQLISKRIPLDPKEINAVLDELEDFSGKNVRTVIVF